MCRPKQDFSFTKLAFASVEMQQIENLVLVIWCNDMPFKVDSKSIHSGSMAMAQLQVNFGSNFMSYHNQISQSLFGLLLSQKFCSFPVNSLKKDWKQSKHHHGQLKCEDLAMEMKVFVLNFISHQNDCYDSLQYCYLLEKCHIANKLATKCTGQGGEMDESKAS